jgi:hypothetical protein
MEAARGGVLFIDEAYALGQGLYGGEAITKLLSMLTGSKRPRRVPRTRTRYTALLKRFIALGNSAHTRSETLRVSCDSTCFVCAFLQRTLTWTGKPSWCWRDTIRTCRK